MNQTWQWAILTLILVAPIQLLGAELQPRVLPGHMGSVMAVAFSPDGKTLASSSRDQTVKLWDVVTGTLQQTLAGHADDVYAVEFSGDGKLLASGSGDTTIKLWEVPAMKVIRTLA